MTYVVPIHVFPASSPVYRNVATLCSIAKELCCWTTLAAQYILLCRPPSPLLTRGHALLRPLARRHILTWSLDMLQRTVCQRNAHPESALTRGVAPTHPSFPDRIVVHNYPKLIHCCARQLQCMAEKQPSVPPPLNGMMPASNETLPLINAPSWFSSIIASVGGSLGIGNRYVQWKWFLQPLPISLSGVSAYPIVGLCPQSLDLFVQVCRRPKGHE